MPDEKTALREAVEETCRWLRKKIPFTPEIGIVLGTGLGKIAERVENPVSIPFEDIPNFLVSTAPGHTGRLVAGKIGGKAVLVLEGRFHCYEGYSMQDITFPVRVLKGLGGKILILTCASGAMNPEYHKGDLVAITDHINFMGTSPLIGPNDAKLGERFPDMCEPYSSRLIGLTQKIAAERKIPLRKGVYIGVLGPNLETRAEYRFMRMLGADIVGMSTVPEVIAGVHAGLEILALSIATDVCIPDTLEPVNIDEIIKTAREASPRMDLLIEETIKAI